MSKAEVRGDRLTVIIPSAIRDEIALRDGDEFGITVEGGRIVLTPAAEEPLPGELEALDEAEAELAAGQAPRGARWHRLIRTIEAASKPLWPK